MLSVAHSYCVALNRRLAHELARADGGKWEVTAIAPAFFHGDLRPISCEPEPGEACITRPVAAYLSRRIHFFFYGIELREILQQPWNLVHCWEEPYILAGGQIAWWTPRITPLVFWTGQTRQKSYPPPFSSIERFSIDRCAGWIARGETGEQALLARGYGRRPHRVLPLGVDTEHFKPDCAAREAIRIHLGWNNEDAPVVGYSGRFVEEKGVRMLTRVLDALRCDWRAMFIGGGPLEGYLREWSARHGDRVRIVTGVTHARVPEYLNAMDLLCAPSQTAPNWQEVFGRMLVEAFACGVPVVASDSGDIPRVVGDAGIILGEQNEADWSDALAQLIESPARRRELAARGVDWVRDRYAWPIVARKHLEFFEELM